MALLLRHGAAVDGVTAAGVTPLMTSVHDLEKVRLLVEKGAGVNAQSASGQTPLRLAGTLPGGAAVAKYLLSRGAAPDSAVLRVAVARGHREIARDLLARGIAPDASVITAAVNARDVAMLKTVLQKTAQAPPLTRASGRTLLMNAAFTGPAEMVSLLLERGEAVNAVDDRKRTALMNAAASEFSSIEVAKALLASGADPSIQDVRGDRALDFARHRGDLAMVRLLGGQSVAPAKPAPSATDSLPPVRTALERALRLLDVGGPGFFKANACISCHHQSIPQMAAGKTRPAGVAGDPAVAKAQVKAVLGVWGGEVNRMWQNTCSVGGGQIATMTYGLVGLAAENQPATQTIDLVTSCLAAVQSPDGSWVMPDPRPPLGVSPIKYTALAIRALQAYTLPGRKAEFAKRIERARQYLEGIEPEDTQGWAFRVLGMKWAGSSASAITKAADRLAALQRADGGWSQLPAMESDAYATAQAVWALHEGAGYPISDRVWLRGATYLRTVQKPDGSWHVRARGFGFQPYRETGFPHGHDQWISSAATGFAVIALAPLLSERTTRQ
jgi:ankyrin repeat protein